MKIQYASDLHLELSGNSRWIGKNPLEVTGDVLLLAGDVVYLGSESHIKHPFWDWCSDNYKQTLVVPGNHEYYGGYDVRKLGSEFSLDVRDNVRYVNNKVVAIDGVDIILSTLWAHIRIEDALMTEQGINDFRRIIFGGERLTFSVFNRLHEESLQFLKQAVKNSNALKKVVVTHHLPSHLLVEEQFRGSRLNGAFMSEQSDWIAESDIDYWIYGHSHSNIDDIIGSTICVANQLGYISSNLEPSFGFDAGKVIELKM